MPLESRSEYNRYLLNLRIANHILIKIIKNIVVQALLTINLRLYLSIRYVSECM